MSSNPSKYEPSALTESLEHSLPSGVNTVGAGDSCFRGGSTDSDVHGRKYGPVTKVIPITPQTFDLLGNAHSRCNSDPPHLRTL